MAAAERIRAVDRLVADDVGVDPQGDGRVDVAESRCHDLERDPGKQQCTRVNVAQVVQAGSREPGLGGTASSQDLFSRKM